MLFSTANLCPSVRPSVLLLCVSNIGFDKVQLNFILVYCASEKVRAADDELTSQGEEKMVEDWLCHAPTNAAVKMDM